MVILNKQRIRGSFSFLLTNLIPDAVNLCTENNFLEMDAATRRQLKKNRKKVLQVSLLVYPLTSHKMNHQKEFSLLISSVT